MANFVLTVFKKEVKTTKVNEKGVATVVQFPTYFGKANGMKGSIAVRLTNEIAERVKNEKINFPLDFELSTNDYFLTTEDYENAEGIVLEKAVCVIQGFQTIKEAEIKKATLEDYFKGIQNSDAE